MTSRPTTPRAAALAAAVITSLLMLPAAAGASHSLYQHISDTDLGLPGNGAFDPTFHRSSSDGSRVFFSTTERLAPADDDFSQDIYERTQGLTVHASGGEVNGNGAVSASFRGSSSDGSRMFFETSERLVAADTDSSVDVYEYSSFRRPVLVSAGASGGNGASDSRFRGASSDGSRVFFETVERLVAADTDSSTDIYQRSAGATELISGGGDGSSKGAFLVGNSADGSRVFIETAEKLLAADTDGSVDLYERSNGTTKLLSAGAVNGNGAFNAIFMGASTNGARVFFQTTEKLVAGDTDAAQDVYQRSGGTTTRISAGAVNGNGALSASWRGTSADGTKVFFQTTEKLVVADTDASQDVYERSGGATKLVSAGALNGNGAIAATFAAASADGLRVYFTTNEKLVGQDGDSGKRDIYRRTAEGTSLITDGSGPFDASFEGVSADGRRVFFETAEGIDPRDVDGRMDVYEADASQLDELRRISPGNGAFAAEFKGASTNGSAVFFTTREKVIATDEDASIDIYGAYALD